LVATSSTFQNKLPLILRFSCSSFPTLDFASFGINQEASSTLGTRHEPDRRLLRAEASIRSGGEVEEDWEELMMDLDALRIEGVGVEALFKQFWIPNMFLS